MKQSIFKDQRGIGHLGLIIAAVVVLATGGVGYFVYSKNKANTPEAIADKALQTALKNAKCDYDDKDLCKFFTSYKVQKYFTINTVSEADGQKTTMLLKTEGDGKSYVKIDGDTPYEIITIGNSTYTKAANGTWWKQTSTTTNTPAAEATDNAKVDFEEPTTEAAKTTYKKVGKEKCGDFTCFKYQEINPGDTATITYLWFDDEDYQLRRTQTTNSDGSKSDATYSYTKVSITEPSPVKELGPNQYLIPGQSEPTTLPSSDSEMTPEELQQLMQQYSN